ncbi:MAG: hypothetical protein HRT89_07200 [Lentisphaeria bacterium]|nr:hypothetical protein [Lentisphaeria bacterium]NQZ67840.1 hypothetical protein [Lentisphaeria bacterium]
MDNEDKNGVKALRESIDNCVRLDMSSAQIDSLDPMIIQNPKGFVHHHSYGGLTPFYKGLTEGKLMGTRNPNPNAFEKRIWLPPRLHDPDSWELMEWVEVEAIGKIHTYSTVLYPGACFRGSIPCPLISVEIAGVCTKMMSYLSEGIPEIGMPIKAKFNTHKPSNTILDISWVEL